MLAGKAHRLKALAKAAHFRLAALGIAPSENERRLLAMKNMYRDRRAFVIGNGPSLRRTDITLLKDEVTIGCNGLFLLFEETGFLPTFYTVEDPLVAEDRAAVINSIRGTHKVFPYDLRRWLRPDEETVYVNFPRRYPGFPRFSGRFESRAFWGGSVTFFNLQLAFYLGVREVYLIGMDHTYNTPAGGDEMKGSVVTSHNPDVNHFHPDYFGPGFRYHDPKVDRMEEGYRKAREFFERNGGAIYNATDGGRLEVFERADFSSVVRKQGPTMLPANRIK